MDAIILTALLRTILTVTTVVKNVETGDNNTLLVGAWDSDKINNLNLNLIILRSPKNSRTKNV